MTISLYSTSTDNQLLFIIYPQSYLALFAWNIYSPSYSYSTYTPYNKPCHSIPLLSRSSNPNNSKPALLMLTNYIFPMIKHSTKDLILVLWDQNLSINSQFLPSGAITLAASIQNAINKILSSQYKESSLPLEHSTTNPSNPNFIGGIPTFMEPSPKTKSNVDPTTSNYTSISMLHALISLPKAQQTVKKSVKNSATWPQKYGTTGNADANVN